MSAKLHEITPAPLNEDVVDLLENLLERARDGDFAAIAVAMVDREGVTSTGWSEQYLLGTMIGAVASLQARLIKELQG